MVTALARALRLDTSERDHLFRCANLAPPSAGNVSRHVPVRVQRLVSRLGGNPTAVFAADWTLIGWNAMWSATVGDPRTYGWEARNLVDGMFRSRVGRGREPIAGWPVRSWEGDEVEEEDLVADLRVTAAAHPEDARLAAFVDRLLRSNPRFARLWFNGSARTHVGDRKTIEHPQMGDIALDLDVLLSARHRPQDRHVHGGGRDDRRGETGRAARCLSGTEWEPGGDRRVSGLMLRRSAPQSWRGRPAWQLIDESCRLRRERARVIEGRRDLPRWSGGLWQHVAVGDVAAFGGAGPSGGSSGGS